MLNQNSRTAEPTDPDYLLHMEITPVIKMIRIHRQRICEFTKSLEPQFLTTIPEGWTNTITWHLGHILVTGQLLTLGRLQIPLGLPETYLELFRKGTKPESFHINPHLEELLHFLGSTPNLWDEYLQGDVRQTEFKDIFFEPYITSSGMELKTLEEAIVFNFYHEGLHFSSMRAMARTLAQQAATPKHEHLGET